MASYHQASGRVTRHLRTACLLLACFLPVSAQVVVDESLRLEGRQALQRGAAWLLAQQAENGGWSDHPGITAMAVLSLARSPAAEQAATKDALGKALGYIRRHARTDGPIVTAAAVGNEVYSTAAAAMALAVLGEPADRELLLRARTWLLAEGERGGLGYRGLGYSNQKYPDLSNTHWVLEALHLVDPILGEQLSAADKERAARFWQRALALIKSCQLGKAAADVGGFTYYPVHAGRRQTTAPEAESAHAELPVNTAWGSLTWGALKCFAFAKYDAQDQVIVNARLWVSRRGSWKEHPGLGAGGYYYYSYMLSSGAVAWNWDQWPDAKGQTRSWRLALLPELLARQSGEGAWANPNPLWLEQDPRLCTAYAMMALEMCLLAQ